MSFEMKKYMGGYEPEEHVEFYPCVVMQALGDAVFAYVAELEEGVYLLKDPCRVINNLGKGMMELQSFCEFSDDQFYIMKEGTVESIAFLSDAYLSTYQQYLQAAQDGTSTDQPEVDIYEVDDIATLH